MDRISQGTLEHFAAVIQMHAYRVELEVMQRVSRELIEAFEIGEKYHAALDAMNIRVSVRIRQLRRLLGD
jgi:hypothetical protein